LRKYNTIRFEKARFWEKPALYALKTLNFKLTLPSLGVQPFLWQEAKICASTGY
jgi:hypothetical protein